MNNASQQNQLLSIEVKNVGPIVALKGNFAVRKQNLIYAQNGAGKSFIARALRLLGDSTNSSSTETEIPSKLVSEESIDGEGKLILNKGNLPVSSLVLNTTSKLLNVHPPKYIFHVFSQGYIDEELRNKLDKLNGEITHEIIFGRENVELDEIESELVRIQADLQNAISSSENKFAASLSEHKNRFGISALLGAYKSLKFDVYIQNSVYTPDSEPEPSKELLKQYEN